MSGTSEQTEQESDDSEDLAVGELALAEAVYNEPFEEWKDGAAVFAKGLKKKFGLESGDR